MNLVVIFTVFCGVFVVGMLACILALIFIGAREETRLSKKGKAEKTEEE
ncbi:MAG: hypothetical protein PHO26_10895 [Dehalococcoidia bacterium]|nr:hypothetical protein [Dehalococcoidia bacterium]MDD5493596.1 hypothetical protein [Dehalococcoidia bacterium]